MERLTVRTGRTLHQDTQRSILALMRRILEHTNIQESVHFHVDIATDRTPPNGRDRLLPATRVSVPMTLKLKDSWWRISLEPKDRGVPLHHLHRELSLLMPTRG